MSQENIDLLKEGLESYDIIVSFTSKWYYAW